MLGKPEGELPVRVRTELSFSGAALDKIIESLKGGRLKDETLLGPFKQHCRFVRYRDALEHALVCIQSRFLDAPKLNSEE